MDPLLGAVCWWIIEMNPPFRGYMRWIIRYLFLVLFILPSSFKFGKTVPNEVLLPCQEKPLNPLDLCIKWRQQCPYFRDTYSCKELCKRLKSFLKEHFWILTTIVINNFCSPFIIYHFQAILASKNVSHDRKFCRTNLTWNFEIRWMHWWRLVWLIVWHDVVKLRCH